jgi:hypothetical protein
MTGPSARPPSSPRRTASRILALAAPVAAAAAVAHLLPAVQPLWLGRLAVFAGVKLGADLLRGRAWPGRERYAEDLVREWIAWSLVACVYTAAAQAAAALGRPAPSPVWPALLAYWLLWLP